MTASFVLNPAGYSHKWLLGHLLGERILLIMYVQVLYKPAYSVYIYFLGGNVFIQSCIIKYNRYFRIIQFLLRSLNISYHLFNIFLLHVY